MTTSSRRGVPSRLGLGGGVLEGIWEAERATCVYGSWVGSRINSGFSSCGSGIVYPKLLDAVPDVGPISGE